MIFSSSSPSSKSGFIDDDEDDDDEEDAFAVTFLLSAFSSIKFGNKLFPPLDIIEQKPGDGGRLP
jgi:hypothetical protein|tara:strand:- start:503 stop:697 length:195 start_codon:yes stop_codon:yes gene_type:complete